MTPKTESRINRSRRVRTLADSDAVCVAAAAVVALIVYLMLPPAPSRIDAITVTNPTNYDIAVQVRGSTGGWVPLSTVHRHSTATVPDVIDQGDTWTFRVKAQGQAGGEFHLERDALENTDWAVEIPPSAEQTLREAGAPLPP